MTGTDRTSEAFCWAKLTLTAAWSRPLTCEWPVSVIVTGIVADGVLEPDPPLPEPDPPLPDELDRALCDRADLA